MLVVLLGVGLSLFSQKGFLELHSSALSPLQQQKSDAAVPRVAAVRVLGGGGEYPVLVTMGHFGIVYVRKWKLLLLFRRRNRFV